jgi:rod shape-determining protein MreD
VSPFVLGTSLVAFAFLQATLIPSAEFVPIVPDVTLVIILVWSAVRGVREGLLWAFMIGILLDTLALDPLGANGLALLPVVLLGGIAGQRFFHSSLIVPILACILGTFLHAIVLLLVRSSGGETLPLASLVRLITLQTILNVMIVPPIYLIGSLAQRPVGTRHA